MKKAIRIAIIITMVILSALIQQGCSKKITEIYLSQNSAEIALDEVLQLKYTVFPEDADKEGVKWTSVNEDVAIVSEDGLVKPVSEGSTTIICSTKSGLKVTCELVVKPLSAIKQLNEYEMGLFEYLVKDLLTSAYNAPAIRLRNIYGDAESVDIGYTIDLQGTNKLGGTVYKQYIVFVGKDGKYTCLDGTDYFNQSIATPMDTNTLDFAKVNAALEEYWSDKSVN